MTVILLLILGLLTGILSGIIGIGGGIIIIPALVFLFNMSQQHAQGTTLAMMVPPIGILAAVAYYKAGFVDIKVAGILCIGFLFGGFFGAKLALIIPSFYLKKVFSIIMILIALKMFFSK